jgi:hypothetical protein
MRRNLNAARMLKVSERGSSLAGAVWKRERPAVGQRLQKCLVVPPALSCSLLVPHVSLPRKSIWNIECVWNGNGDNNAEAGPQPASAAFPAQHSDKKNRKQ